MYLSPKSTSRLTIRPLTIDDISAWAEFFENNEGLRFFNFDDKLSSEEKAKQWIDRQLWRYENNLFGLMALIEKGTNTLVGQCGLLVQEIDEKREIEIGYHVLPKFWGKGFATEAAQFFKQFAFEHKIADSVISIIHVENSRSQRVAEKNGMERTIQTVFHIKPVFVYWIEKIES